MTLAGCFANPYNSWLVLVSLLVCVAGSVTTFNLLPRAARVTREKNAFLWGALTTITGASSIWSTHFIAIIGFRPASEIGFDPLITAISFLVALTMVGAAMLLLISFPHRLGQAVGGTVLGLGIVAMHYVGIAGMTVAGHATWNAGPIAWSVFFSIAFSLLAVLSFRQGRSRAYRMAGAGWFCIAITTLHFTGMHALVITPDPAADLPDTLLSGEPLAIAVAAITLLILGSALVAWAIDKRTSHENEQRLRFIARHDALTGLPNRAFFEEVGRRELAQFAESGAEAAIFCLDLDGLKTVNEIYGHKAGDALLAETASRLQSMLGQRCMAARFGGDEFVILVTGIGKSKTINGAAQMVIDTLSRPCETVGGIAEVTCTIGVAHFPTDGGDCEQLIGRATLALHRAKQDGKGVFRYFDPVMDETMRSRHQLAQDLRLALPEQQLHLVYQPQVDLRSARVVGFEALLRWQHPTRGAVPPAVFIPKAEQSGLIIPIGTWVLREACREAASWPQPLRVSVNVSVAQFKQSDLVQSIAAIIEETGLAPERLEIEVTESLLIDSAPGVLQRLADIKQLGVRIAMDDFGTGYSSLLALQSFSFDVLKIDRSFVQQASEESKNGAIVKAVLGLGQNLGIEIVAEGVETVAQKSFLQGHGCDTAQGYLCGKPERIDHYRHRMMPETPVAA